MRSIYTFLSPPIQSYNDQSLIFITGFIVPNIASTLWTFGFIVMHNQRLDAENLAEKGKILRLIQQLEIERNTAQQNSLTDSLTGLANRRYFDEALKIEFNRSKRSGFILSLIMLDIDYFKEFNDSYGHLAGDDCLRQIGSVFKIIVRRLSDIVARYGGEEFVVLLPETDENGARALAEGIQKAIEELAIPNPDSHISEFVTVSLGIVTLRTTALTLPEQVVALADEALYNAKKGGRNRIEVATLKDDGSSGN
jgi:diguanylate cyclase (GGDEF)-like protein